MTSRSLTAPRSFGARCSLPVLIALAGSVLPASGLLAQQPAQPPIPVVSAAEERAAKGDTAGAYALLDSAVRRDKRDAAAWHQLGLLTWSMAKGGRDPEFIKDPKVVRLLTQADTALRLATQFAPDSARYWMSLSRFNLASGLSTMRFSARGQAGAAAGAATRAGDTLMLAEAADEVGLGHWRSYEAVSNRAIASSGAGVDLSSIQRKDAVDYLRSVAGKIKPPTGEADYQKAVENFILAERGNRTSQRFARHLFMALGERGRWEEMRSLARDRTRTFPLDYVSFLAIGLASHRLSDEKTANVAFDSAMALMDDDERERMNQLTRILRPTAQRSGKKNDPRLAGGDARSFMALNEGARKGLEAMYWMMSDPLALTNENEFRLEFLSRVVWADFRFSNEDMGLRGADTDRGDILVRYGPPEEVVTVGPSGNASFAANTARGVTVAWIYPDNLAFFFDLTPGFATARTFFQDRDFVNQVKAAVPVSWANVPSTKLLDTIPIRIVRFRARGDSADAVIAASVPMDSLTRGLEMSRVPVDVDFRVLDQFVKVRGVESVQSSLRPDSAGSLARVWTRRLGPGINVVRVEAMQLDSRRAARAMSRVDPEASSGFGMSDVLLGGRPEPRAANLVPGRWTDIDITPSVGSYAPGTPVGIVWEVYDLLQRDNTTKYRVAVSVQRTDKSPLGSVASRLFDGLGRTVGRQQTRRDEITYTFDRTGGPVPAVVEYLALDLPGFPRGAYRLRVDVIDLNANKRTSRSAEFQIR